MPYFPLRHLRELGGFMLRLPVSGREAASAAPFEAFFRRAYRPLIRDVIFAGGNLYEAEDAVAAAMEEVLQRWDTIESPQAYTRRAAISNLIKAKKRGTTRIVNRLVEHGEVPAECALDPGLTVWEQQEWVTALLMSLPPAQREVLACIVDEFTVQENGGAPRRGAPPHTWRP